VKTPKSLLIAASRWLGELRSDGSILRAKAVLLNTAAFADISQTQYMEALEWLQNAGVVEMALGPDDGEAVIHLTGAGPDGSVGETVISAVLSAEVPQWLEDVDMAVDGPDDLPLDLVDAAGALAVGGSAAMRIARSMAWKVDLERRREVGLAGERAVMSLIEQLISEGRLPSETKLDWVSSRDDSAGYDILVRTGSAEHLLEVKTSVRRADFRAFLSRNEFETGRSRAAEWAVVGVLLTPDLSNPTAVGHTDHPTIASVAPRDVSRSARWESIRLSLGRLLVYAGLPLPVDGDSGIAVIGFAGPVQDRPSWAAFGG
jgi:hypothetical protein